MSSLFSLAGKWNRRQVHCLGLIVMLVSGLGCTHSRDTDSKNTGPLNATFKIDERQITLVNGYAELTAAPESASKITTQVWGKPELADLNGDGRQDAALILIHSGGGSGSFYYLAPAVRNGDHYQGGTALLLGDRIEPKQISITERQITVRFLGRNQGEALATPPSHAMEQRFIYDAKTQRLVAVAVDFSGEADPARMTLPMKTWYWLNTRYNDDSLHTPRSAETFSLTFTQDGSVLVTTDCNSMRGQYTVADSKIHFEKLASTRMYCEGSQELAFAKMLDNVSSYFFTNRGQLVLELQYDSGSIIFQ